MNCPYSSYIPATLTFCEEKVCGWIAQPANTLSNLAFILAAFLVLRFSKSTNAKWFSSIIFLTGIGSIAFHGSETFIGEVLDLSAMYLFASYLLCMTLIYFGFLKPFFKLPFVFGITLFAAIHMIVTRQNGIVLFAVMMTFYGLLQIVLFRRGLKIKWASLGALSFIAAFLVWNLDIQGIICHPQNHFFQLHGAWHIFCALSQYFFFRHHELMLQKR